MDNNQALETLLAISKDIKETFSISHAQKHYHFVKEKTTVRFVGKSFIEVGENSLYKAIKLAIRHVVFTYSAYAEMKAKWIEKEMGEVDYCLPLELGSGIIIKRYKN